jgi:hypothetical protein
VLKQITRRGGAVGVLIACLALAVGGCAKDRLSFDGYSSIQAHKSTRAEVEETLGKPSSQAGNQWIYSRFDKSLEVIITFDASGVVSRKMWVDPGTWDDSAKDPT